MKNVMFAALGALTLLGGCATDPVTGQTIGNRTAIGAVAGALGGAALGTVAGGNDGRNAAIGAAVGALAGAGIGRYMDQQEADMRKAVAGTGIGVQRVGDHIELVMPSDITFGKNQDSINASFYPTLNQVAKSLNLYPKTTIDIIGHADSDGGDQMNLDLSRRRAASVQTYLAGQKVASMRMRADGMGESQPLVPNTSEANKAKNRRVEIILAPLVQ